MPREGVRQGQVYWLDDCPPFAGEQAKRRPVVVVSPPAVLERAAEVIVAAVSTSTLDQDRILLPTLDRNPRATSGLRRTCWAVPRWYVPVARERLTGLAGHIAGKVLRDVVAAFERASAP